uniref:Immunoglobulin domain-containing protein n=1 Tax=Timema douglasi TaxID=61478 RepID=A0A7R8VHZ7_TIMDO|nr:unnamed protein product [Timema douglasi]
MAFSKISCLSSDDNTEEEKMLLLVSVLEDEENLGVQRLSAMNKLLEVMLWLAALEIVAALSHIEVQEVPVGATAVLPCLSNDDNHRFQFWQLIGDQVVGPGNLPNRDKYKFEVLTGTLYIRSVSTAEAGFYKCISKGIEGSDLSIKSVELIVKKDWDEVYENDYETNLFRGLVAVGSIVVLLVAGILAFYIYRRRKGSRFGGMVSRLKTIYVFEGVVINLLDATLLVTDISDEESPDEEQPRGTYNPTTVSKASTSSKKLPVSQGVDNAGLEVDFPQVFKAMQQQNSVDSDINFR